MKFLKIYVIIVAVISLVLLAKEATFPYWFQTQDFENRTLGLITHTAISLIVLTGYCVAVVMLPVGTALFYAMKWVGSDVDKLPWCGLPITVAITAALLSTWIYSMGPKDQLKKEDSNKPAAD